MNSSEEVTNHLRREVFKNKKIKKLHIIILLVISVLVFYGSVIFIAKLDTTARRKKVAARLQSLASQYRGDPRDKSPLAEIRRTASAPYTFGRSYAMGVLADLSEVDNSVVSDIGNGLRDKDPYVRHSAGAALNMIAVSPQDAADDVIYILTKHPNEAASSFATEAIIKMGHASKEMLDALEASAKSKDSYDDGLKRRAYQILSGREMP